MKSGYEIIAPCKGIQGSLGARSIQPKVPEISVQNSMDRFGPTGKVSKKRVHLLRWTTFPGRTGWNFGWKDGALGFWIHMEIAQSKYCTQFGFISQLTGLDWGSQSLVGSGLFHLGCIPHSKAQDSRFHKQKNMGRTYFTGIYVFQWYRSESYHIRYSRGVKKLHSPFWADWGRFPFDKHSDLKFRKIYVTNATVHSGQIPVAHTRPKPPRVWLLLL